MDVDPQRDQDGSMPPFAQTDEASDFALSLSAHDSWLEEHMRRMGSD